ncbi:hypothetical protein [Flavobacterium sp. ZS1P14]|uniref:hypothetical protein n=1 Tax=Flavobacterium sp. ZS1P14 TaxID=3401729 RepID=UPI003AAA8F94
MGITKYGNISDTDEPIYETEQKAMVAHDSLSLENEKLKKLELVDYVWKNRLELFYL